MYTDIIFKHSFKSSISAESHNLSMRISLCSFFFFILHSFSFFCDISLSYSFS